MLSVKGDIREVEDMVLLIPLRNLDKTKLPYLDKSGMGQHYVDAAGV